MSKYAITDIGSSAISGFTIGDNFIRDSPARKKWFKDSFDEAVQDFFERTQHTNAVRDPLEFMVNQHKYALIVVTDNYILSGLIRLDLYADIAGSLTFNQANSDNSAQEPAESA